MTATITIAHDVILPDGTRGVLIGLTYRTRLAKIHTTEGRYRRLPASMLTLAPRGPL